MNLSRRFKILNFADFDNVNQALRLNINFKYVFLRIAPRCKYNAKFWNMVQKCEKIFDKILKMLLRYRNSGQRLSRHQVFMILLQCF